MPECSVCYREVDEDEVIYCYDCGRPLWEDCGYLRLCPDCEEVWEIEEKWTRSCELQRKFEGGFRF